MSMSNNMKKVQKMVTIGSQPRSLAWQMSMPN